MKAEVQTVELHIVTELNCDVDLLQAKIEEAISELAAEDGAPIMTFTCDHTSRRTVDFDID